MTLYTQGVWFYLTTGLVNSLNKGENSGPERSDQLVSDRARHRIQEFRSCGLGYPAPPLPGAPLPVCPEVWHRREEWVTEGYAQPTSYCLLWFRLPDLISAPGALWPPLLCPNGQPPLTPSLVATSVTTSSVLVFEISPPLLISSEGHPHFLRPAKPRSARKNCVIQVWKAWVGVGGRRSRSDTVCVLGAKFNSPTLSHWPLSPCKTPEKET